MEIEFASRQLERRYQQHREAVRAWGAAVARKYVQQINILYSAERLEELSGIRSLALHPLKGARLGQHAITLHDRWRLIVVPVREGVVRIREVTQHYGD